MQQDSNLGSLRLQSALFVIIGIGVLYWFYTAATEWWPNDLHLRWLLTASISQVYFFIILWRNLPTNHLAGESELLPGLGAANALTLLRAILLSAVVGFLFLPRPTSIYAWLPGILYVLASLPDYIDGVIARLTGHVTQLGEILDISVDSVGVFTATYLAFQYGVVPWWYLPIGLARYLFLLGIWVRERTGKPVLELSHSNRRRGFAALKMGFMFFMLFPLFAPPGTYLAAAAFGLPFAIGFLWDWGLVTGKITESLSRRVELFGQHFRFIPYLLRLLAIVFIMPFISSHLAEPALVPLAYAEIVVTICLVLGIVPRTAAIIAVCLLGINQNLSPLVLLQNLLIFVYIFLIFTGTARYSLLPLEEWLLINRIGDVQGHEV